MSLSSQSFVYLKEDRQCISFPPAAMRQVSQKISPRMQTKWETWEVKWSLSLCTDTTGLALSSRTSPSQDSLQSGKWRLMLHSLKSEQSNSSIPKSWIQEDLRDPGKSMKKIGCSILSLWTSLQIHGLLSIPTEIQKMPTVSLITWVEQVESSGLK